MSNKLCLYFSETDFFEILPNKRITVGRAFSDATDFLPLLNYIQDEDILDGISRTHFLISYEGERFFIEDKSRNGTWIHAHRLPKERPLPLYTGDEITLKGRHDKKYVIKVEYKVDPSSGAVKSTEDLQHYSDFALKPVQDRLNKLQDIMLLGVAGAGKTTLLNKLRSETQDIDYQSLPEYRFLLFCYFDCLNIKHKEDGRLSAVVFFKELLRSVLEVANNLKMSSDDSQDQILDDASKVQSINATLQVISNLTQTIYKRHHKRVVLLVDHLDNLYHQLSAKIFLDLIELKHLAQSTLIYVIALQNEPGQDNEASRKFLRTLNTYWLPPLKEIQVVGILTLGEQNKKILDTIGLLSGRHPRLTQLVASRLDQMSRLPENMNELLDRLLIDNEINNHCREIWQSLRSDEREALRAAVNSSSSIPKELYDRLVNKKAILRDKGKNLEFASSLFGAFVKLLLLEKVENKIGLHPDTTIPGVLLNGVPIPLTALEMGLFLYLHKNKNIPCSYDQIAENVWPERAASNEAISRVVMSLRQKLKAVSPDAEEYIQNVRGVGYKFVQE